MGLIINPRQIIKDGITSLRDVWSSSKVSTELSGKQATLVSGTNIKTINNTSLLGSGDITISGGGDIPRIDMTATTATLDPNKFYVWGEVASLDISLAAETAGVENIYKFQFQSGEIATTLTLPSSVKWSERNIPTIYHNTTYIISIESGIAKIERKFTSSFLPDGYQEVEFIQSTGSQYIDTGITGQGNLTMKVTLAGEVNHWWGFGSRISENNGAFFYANGGTGYDYNKAYLNYGAVHSIVTNNLFNDGLKHTYTIDKGTYYVDDKGVYTATESAFNNNLGICLFAFNSNGSIGRYYSYKLYECEILNGGTSLSRLIPCYRKSDYVSGLYDTVREQFFGGLFILGPDV